MKAIIVFLILMTSSVYALEDKSKSSMLVEEAKKSIELGDLSMAKSLVNIALIENSKNKKAKSLKIKIENLIKKEKNRKRKKIDLSANTYK